MRIEDIDYDLPESAIAQKPLPDRSASRLLWLHRDSEVIEDRMFRDVVDVLAPGDLLVLNDTRVTALRLVGRKPSGGMVELLLMRSTPDGMYEALAKPGKRLQPGAVVLIEDIRAEIVANLPNGRKLVRVNRPDRLTDIGSVPLPPYIKTSIDDPERYQTVYASQGGSAAAPTAGLHFTPDILDALEKKGVRIARVTLDVGLDTFRPIMVDDPLHHEIHGETCRVPPETSEAVASTEGRIVAVGTTAVRTLESFATGVRSVASGVKETKLFITPGFRFQVVDGMFTNFHMPRTTMLLMISAMAGRESVMRAYEHALSSGYRFLSFGDSMLIL